MITQWKLDTKHVKYGYSSVVIYSGAISDTLFSSTTIQSSIVQLFVLTLDPARCEDGSPDSPMKPSLDFSYGARHSASDRPR